MRKKPDGSRKNKFSKREKSDIKSIISKDNMSKKDYNKLVDMTRDTDKDGVRDKKDCDPYDDTKHGQQQTIGSHKTSITTEGGYTKVKYWDTDVVKFNNEEIILDDGGYMTNTTKSRMNQTSNQYDLGYNVSQKDFKWFVDYKGKKIPFQSGMVIKRNSQSEMIGEREKELQRKDIW